ncbi:MAG: CoA transferase [Coriobacteriia bacterium]|nr:CoA transferase [Coriobacteriia bacterium]
MRVQDIPVFGNLSDVQVIFSGVNIACPFAAYLMAENGARVINLEPAERPENARYRAQPYGFLCERKNELCVNLNMSSEKGQEVFLDLLKTTDIFLEGFKGGTFEKWGLTDERMWEANPKLVIVHISGFGQTGVPEYVSRASYDPIGQCLGGYVWLNGELDGQPQTAKPYTGDYVTALFACWSALAALVGARTNGKGESVDLAMIEALWKIQYDYPLVYFRDGVVKGRMGNNDPKVIGFGAYECGDGEYVFIALSGFGPVTKMAKAIGYSDPELDLEKTMILLRGNPVHTRYDDAIHEFCMQHTAAEVDELMLRFSVPCSRAYNIESIQENPQVKARELFGEWEDKHFGTLKAINPVPKMKNRPQQIWTGVRYWGEDNDDILKDIGYSEETIEQLYEQGIITRTPENGGYPIPAV